MLLMRTGVSASPRAIPMRLASVARATAVARSVGAHHLAGTLVQAFNRKGWAMAMPIVAASTAA